MLDRFDQLHADGLRRALTMKDLETAKAQGAPIIIQDSEGMQWLGGHLERIEEAHRRGTRKLQLVHSRNDPLAPLGDLQNPPSTEFNGLTPIGADVVRECNRLGIVVDLAHGNQKMVEGALKIATKPLLVSHTALNSPTGKGNQPGMLPRLVSREHAKEVASAGGVVGVWHLFDTMKEYVAEVREMVDAIGADSVGIGTDSNIVDATNTMWPDESGGFLHAVAGEMLKQGFTPDEIGKIAGGNFCRVFAKATGA
jgi:membrane dipeptidase